MIRRPPRSTLSPTRRSSDLLDGVPHVMKGMMHPLTVTGGATPATPEPASDVTIKLTEYDFQLSRPLTAGKRVVRVENAGRSEEHTSELQSQSNLVCRLLLDK